MPEGLTLESAKPFLIDKRNEQVREHNARVTARIKNDVERLYSGNFTQMEELAANTSPDPAGFKRNLALTFFLADKLGKTPSEINSTLDQTREVYFDLESNEQAYNATLLLRGHKDQQQGKTKAPTRTLMLPPGGDKTRVDFGKDFGTEPFSFLEEFKRSAARGTGQFVFGATAGALDLLGFQDAAATVASENRLFQEHPLLTTDPRIKAFAERDIGTLRQFTTPEFWVTTFPETVLPNLLLFGAGTLAVRGGASLLFKAKTLSRLSPIIKKGGALSATSTVLAVAESAIESGAAIGEVQKQQEDLLNQSLAVIERMDDDQKKTVLGKSMIKAVQEMQSVEGLTRSKILASNAASEVFARNVVVNSITELVTLSAGSAFVKLLKKPIADSQILTLAAGGTSLTAAATVQAEQELRQDEISDAAVFHALTGKMLDLDMFDAKTIKALAGDDPQKKQTALISMFMSARSGFFQVASDVFDAGSISEFEGNVKKFTDEIAERIASTKEDDAPVPGVIQKAVNALKQATTVEEKATIIKAQTKEIIPRITEELQIQQEQTRVETEITKEVDRRIGEIDAELSEFGEPEPTTQATVAEIQAGIDKIDFGDIKVTPVQAIEDIPNIDLEQIPFTEQEIQEFQQDTVNNSNVSVLRNEIIQAGGINTAGFKELLGIPIRFRGKGGKAFNEVMIRAEELGLFNPDTQTEEDVIDLFKGSLKSKLGFSKIEPGLNEGVFIDRNGGEIFLIADNITPERIKPVILHEVFHAGLRKSTKDVAKLMDQVFAGLDQEQIEELAGRYDLDLTTRAGRSEVAEEFLARVAEDHKADPNLLQRIIAAVREFLRNIGVKLKFSDNDINVIISRSIKAPKRTKDDILTGQVRFSKASPIEGDAFKKWFGDSKVVDEDGQPLVVFHGTQAEFTEFDLTNSGKTDEGAFGRGFYFSNDINTARGFSNRKVLRVFLSLQNPLIIDWNDSIFDKKMISNLKSLGLSKGQIQEQKEISEGFQGRIPEGLESHSDQIREHLIKNRHDGLIVENRFSTQPEYIEYIAFQPTQVKSATNVGTFDSTTPDIRFSLTPNQEQRRNKLLAEKARLERIAKNPHKFKKEVREILQKRRAEVAKEAEKISIERGFRPETIALAGNDIVEKIKAVTIKPFPKREPGFKPKPPRPPSKKKGIKPDEEIDEEALILEDAVNLEAPAEPQRTDPVPAEKIEKIIEDAKKSVLDEMSKDRTIPGERINQKSPIFFEAFKKTMMRVLGKANDELVYGRSRTTITNKIRKLESSGTRSSTTNRIADIVQQINRTRSRSDARELMKKVDRILQAKKIWKRESRSEELTKKDMHPDTRRWLKHVRNVYRRGQEHIEDEIAVIQRYTEQPSNEIDVDGSNIIMKHIIKNAPSFKDSFYKTIHIQQAANIYLKALIQYGSLQNRTPQQIAEALETIQDDINKGAEQVASLAREQVQSDGDFIIATMDAIKPRKDLKFKEPGIFSRASTQPFQLHLFLRDMIRFGRVENRERAKAESNKLFLELQKAQTQEDTEIRQSTEIMNKKLQEIYGDKTKKFGQDFRSIRKRLEKPQEKFRKYSKNEFPRALSKMNLLQIYAQGLQKDLLPGFEENGRDGNYFEELTKELSPQDLQLYDWLLLWYEESRSSLSKLSEKIYGLPVVSPAYNYMPAQMVNTRDAIRTMHTSVSVHVKRFTERVQHRRDINEEVSILNLWSQTVRENARFKAGANIHLKMTRLFSHSALLEQIKSVHGEPYLSAFSDHVADVIAGGFPTNGGNELIDDVRAYVTLTALGVSPVVSLKQVTSIPTFGLEIGLANTVKHFTALATPEGRQAINIIWNSEQRKNRFSTGINEGFYNAITRLSDTQLYRYAQFGMIGISFGDIAPTLIIGPGIYLDYFKSAVKRGVSDKQARSDALDNLFMIVNRTQQSTNIVNQALWLRRGGTAGRALGQFGNATSALTAHDLANIRELTAGAGSGAERFNQYMNVLMINHFLMPALFNAMGLFYNIKILGNDPDDEEEFFKMIAAMIAGPWAGYIVLGFATRSTIETLILGRRDFWRKMLPLQKASDDAAMLALVLRHLAFFEFDEAAEDFDKFLKGQTGFYRTLKDAYKNAAEEE